MFKWWKLRRCNRWISSFHKDLRNLNILNLILKKGCILPSTDVSSHVPTASTTNNQVSEANTGNQSQISNQNQTQTSNANQNSSSSSSSTTSSSSNQNGALDSKPNPPVVRIQSPNSTGNNKDSNQTGQQTNNQQTQSQQQQQGQQTINANGSINSLSVNVKRRPEINETVFKVNKGVKTFDFSFEKNLLITGG